MKNPQYDKLIKAPSWKPDAILTSRGWTHPKTGEVLISRKVDPDVLAYYNEQQNAKVNLNEVVPPAQNLIDETVTNAIETSIQPPDAPATEVTEVTADPTVNQEPAAPLAQSEPEATTKEKPKRNYKKKPTKSS